MIRQLKKQARQILHKNYKLFLFPVILLIFSNFATGYLLYGYFNISTIFKNVYLLAFLIIKLLVRPILAYLLFKTSAKLINQDVNQDKLNSSIFSFGEFLKIVLIMLVPNALDVVSSLLDGVGSYHILPENLSFGISLVALIISGALLYLEYKFFASHYYYALNKSTVKDTLAASFSIMKGCFLKNILLTLSFVLWYLLGSVLALLVTRLFGINDFYQFLLQACGCGVYLYLLPYEYLTGSLFIKNISKNKD